MEPATKFVDSLSSPLRMTFNLWKVNNLFCAYYERRRLTSVSHCGMHWLQLTDLQLSSSEVVLIELCFSVCPHSVPRQVWLLCTVVTFMSPVFSYASIRSFMKLPTLLLKMLSKLGLPFGLPWPTKLHKACRLNQVQPQLSQVLFWPGIYFNEKEINKADMWIFQGAWFESSSNCTTWTILTIYMSHICRIY